MKDRNEEFAEEVPLILVVEDDVDFLSFMVSELEDSYGVISATNGRAGLGQVRESIPDLVITDLMMPVMGGIEFCRRLKLSPESSHIPVIMLTAKASVESKLEGLQTGADDYITKPFDMVLLQARIENLLQSRRLLRERFSKEFVPGKQQPFLENKLDGEFLEQAARMVEEHYLDVDFRPEEFAAALNMSLRSLQRKLKAVVDRSPAGFINEFRMAKAAELLATATDTIAEIAFQVGCDEPSNFSRLFKKYYEMSPSEYRLAHLAP